MSSRLQTAKLSPTKWTGSPPAALLAFGYAVALTTLTVPAALAVLNGYDWGITVKIQALIIMLGSALAVLRAVTAQRFSLIWAIFWAWTFTFLALAPAYQLSNGYFPWNAVVDQNAIQAAQAVIIVACSAVLVSAAIARKIAVRRFQVIKRGPADVPLLPKFILTIYFLLVFQVSLSVIFIILMGDGLLNGRSEFQAQLAALSNITGFGTLYFLTTGTAIIVPAIGVVARRASARVSLPMLVASILTALAVVNPLVGSRFLTGSVLVALAGAFLVNSQGIRLLPGGSILLLVTIFPTLDLLRGDGTGATLIEATLPKETLSSFDYDAFEMLVRESSLNEGLPAGYPSTFDLLIAPFLRWVPVLSDTVSGNASGPQVARATGMGFTNVSMPLWGEFHLVGGMPGVVIAFAVLGLFFGTVSVFRDEASTITSSLRGALIEAPTAALLFIVLRGSLYEVLGYLILALAIWLLLLRTLKGGLSQSPPKLSPRQHLQHRSGTA